MARASAVGREGTDAAPALGVGRMAVTAASAGVAEVAGASEVVVALGVEGEPVEVVGLVEVVGSVVEAAAGLVEVVDSVAVAVLVEVVDSAAVVGSVVEEVGV